MLTCLTAGSSEAQLRLPRVKGGLRHTPGLQQGWLSLPCSLVSCATSPGGLRVSEKGPSPQWHLFTVLIKTNHKASLDFKNNEITGHGGSCLQSPPLERLRQEDCYNFTPVLHNNFEESSLPYIARKTLFQNTKEERRKIVK